MKLINRLEGNEGNVWKYVFEFEAKYPENWHDAPRIAEAVLYKYGTFEDRTVICCSVQSGCKVGCSFCGTGKNFIGQINDKEILEQVAYLFEDMDIDVPNIKKLQIMFMSMGEPMDNIDNVAPAIISLNKLYPHAALLLSTVGLKDHYAEFIIDDISKDIDKVGLQFSIHRSTDESRDKLIPYENKKTLKELVAWGKLWNKKTGRKPYINYVLTDVNSADADYERLTELFDKDIFCVTLSVLCNPKRGGSDNNDMARLKNWHDRFLSAGYDVRTFDPAGKDDIGGGCGQLWFVQDHLKEHGIFKDIDIGKPRTMREFQMIGRGIREGGMRYGEINIMIAGGPSTGKTRFTAEGHMLTPDEPVLIHNFEYKNEDIMKNVEELIKNTRN